MKVAVVTPYYREDIDVLRQCHESVAAQSYPCTHFMIADGAPRPDVSGWSVQHITLPKSHGDNGNTPRAIGSLSAASQGFDAIAYLDADNWYESDHIATMVRLQAATGAVVCTAGRAIHRLDGSSMFVDKTESDGERFADTSCLFLTRAAFRLVSLWATMPKEMAPLCDEVIWYAITARALPRAHSDAPTVAFRTSYEPHYRKIGERAPEGAKAREDATKKAERWWRGLGETDRRRWRDFFATGGW